MTTFIASPFYQSSLSRIELIKHLVMLDMLSLQNNFENNISPSDTKLMWNLFIRHYYQEEFLAFMPDETRFYLKVDNFRDFPVPRFIASIAQLRGDVFFDNAHIWGRFSGISFENFLIDYIWFVKQTFFYHESLSEETFDWMLSPQDDENSLQLPKLAFSIYSGDQIFKEKYDLSQSQQRLAYLVHFYVSNFPGSGCEYPKWLINQISLSPADSGMKLMWNLFVCHPDGKSLLASTADERQFYLEADNFRGFSAPHFITLIAQLRGEDFFDDVYSRRSSVETSFEYSLINYIWFAKQALFRLDSLAKETFDWLLSPEDNHNGYFRLPKLLLSMHAESSELKEKYDISHPKQRLAYLVYFCMETLPSLGYGCPHWLLNEINLSHVDSGMKLIWNLFIRQHYQGDLLPFTKDEIRFYLETDNYRNFPVPRFITSIAELREESFFNDAHREGRLAGSTFEYFLIDYINFVKWPLFRNDALSEETSNWLASPGKIRDSCFYASPSYVNSTTSSTEKTSDVVSQNNFLETSCSRHVESIQPIYETQGVNLVGWPRTAVGIGEDVRVAAHALIEVGISFSIQDAAHRMPPHPAQQNLGVDCYIAESPKYQTDIVFLDAATQYRYYCYDLLRKSHLDRAIIGVCPWELPNWPRELAFALDHLSVFWAATRYIYDAFSPHFQDRIKLAPPAVLLPQEELDDFKITAINEPLTFLTTFDGLSSIHRKNPFAVIKAFRAAFPRTCKDVRLIVKTMNFSSSHPALKELAEEIISDARIELISQALPREELFALVRRSHCFVSLHRSEGFGRNIAEAMLFNRPVICSAYSGNLDFCFEQNSFLVQGQEILVQPGQYAFSNQQTWFDASVEHACARMREVYENREKAEQKAVAGRDYIRLFHSAEATGLRYQKLLQNFIQ